MKQTYIAAVLLTLLPAGVALAIIVAGPARTADADSAPFRCTSSALYFPVSGIIGWTYDDPESTDRDAAGNRTRHTGIDVYADGGAGSPVYAPADGIVTRPPGPNSVNLDLPGVTNLLTGEAGIQIYIAHFSHSLAPGQTVRAGQIIGVQAGDHIHMSIGADDGYDDRELSETQDPSPYFSAALGYGSDVTVREQAANKCYTTAPEPPALPATEQAPAQQTYVVQSGDTLSTIAESFGVALDEIAAANAMTDMDFLEVGQELVIPGGSLTGVSQAAGASPAAAESSSAPAGYVVVEGDTLSSIAERFDTDVDTLMSLNGLTDGDFLSIGQTLTVPGASASASTASTSQTASASASPSQYTVQAGDTLSSIAETFGTDVETLMALNGLTDPDLINVGDVLLLP